MIKKAMLICAAGVLACGCAVPPKGIYEVTATDSSGKPLATHVRILAEGSRIYTARNALCINHPGALVYVRSTATGEKLPDHNPHRCR